MLTCLRCLPEAHSGHEFCTLSEESEKLKGELIDMTSAIAVRESEGEDGRKKFTQALKKLKKDEKSSEDELRKTFRSLIVELESQEVKLFEKLGERCRRVEKMIELEKEESDFALAEFKGYREMSEILLTSGSDVEVAAGHSMLMTRGKTLDELGFCIEPSVNPSVRFHAKNLDAVKQAISSFGDIE